MIERLPGTPPALLERMLGALPVERPEGASIPDVLAEAALSLYAEVIRGDGGREDALPLLAADGLLTHAFHAQAELDAAALPGLAARHGVLGRLGELGDGITS